MTNRNTLLILCLSCALVGGQVEALWAQEDDSTSTDNIPANDSGDDGGAEDGDGGEDGAGEEDGDGSGDVEVGADGAPLQAKPQLDLNIGKSATGVETRKWAVGVSEKDQDTAFALFKKGNEALDRNDYGDAEKLFMDAIGHWNHPAIHYNLALALVAKQGDRVRIYKAFKEATRFGEAPLERTQFKQAERFESFFAAQLATLELRCDEPGTKVMLDGQLILTGPGEFNDLVVAGEHVISATKTGYISINRTVRFKAEKTFLMELVMYTLADRTRYERHFKQWIPWTVAGSGAGVLAIAGLLDYLSIQNRLAYREKVGEDCPNGCQPEYDQSLRHRANLQQKISYVSYGIGGLAAAAGAILIFVNQPRKIVEIDDLNDGSSKNVAIVPIIAPDRIGVSATLSF